jgi:hypothetical protein
MVVDRVAKKHFDFQKKLIISPMGRCHINKTFSLFQEHQDDLTLEQFLKLWGNVSPYKSNNDYIHGLYVYSATPKKVLNIEHLFIPGPIARQTILKQFIEHMISLGMDLQCSMINIYHLNESDWRSLFLKEAGAKRVKPDCLQINILA